MKIVRVVLTIVFGWAFVKSLQLLLSGESFDLLLFDAPGLQWLFYLLLSGLLVCQSASLVWFWRPFGRGYLFAFAAVILNLAETGVACTIAAGNTELAKQAMVTSREARGLAVRPEMLQMMDTPATHFVLLAVAALLAVVWCVLIVLLVRDRRTMAAAKP